MCARRRTGRSIFSPMLVKVEFSGSRRRRTTLRGKNPARAEAPKNGRGVPGSSVIASTTHPKPAGARPADLDHSDPQNDLPFGPSLSFDIPKPLKAEHDELHANLARLTQLGGRRRPMRQLSLIFPALSLSYTATACCPDTVSPLTFPGGAMEAERARHYPDKAINPGSKATRTTQPPGK